MSPGLSQSVSMHVCSALDMRRWSKQGAAYLGGEDVDPSFDVVQAFSNLGCGRYPITSGII